jgi:hypothetical protein
VLGTSYSEKLSKKYAHLSPQYRAVVIVVRNEQEATIQKVTAVIPNTLVLARADFPKVNKKVKDYYPRSVVDAMVAACKNRIFANW